MRRRDFVRVFGSAVVAGSFSARAQEDGLTYRVGGLNLPVAGGGYFRLFPLFMMRAGLHQAARQAAVSPAPQVGMLYFHPWEFDPHQPRLPLGRLSRFRTYVGLSRTRARLAALLRRYRFVRAIDVTKRLEPRRHESYHRSRGRGDADRARLPRRAARRDAGDAGRPRGLRGRFHPE